MNRLNHGVTTITAILMSGVLSACASLDSPSKSQTSGKKNGPIDIQKSAKPQSLAPQVLATDECGLFVWTATPQKRFILFSQNAKANALWYQGGTRILRRLAQEGEPAFKQYPNMKFVRENGETVELILSTPEPVGGGMAYKSGKLSYKTQDGWDKVVPVVGLSACRI